MPRIDLLLSGELCNAFLIQRSVAMNAIVKPTADASPTAMAPVGDNLGSHRAAAPNVPRVVRSSRCMAWIIYSRDAMQRVAV
jgi:hypothetical protein